MHVLFVLAPANIPIVGIPKGGSETVTYFLAIVDPDARSPQNPDFAQYIHLLQPGVKFSGGVATYSTPAFISYGRPSPPNFSDAHRYVDLLYVQPSNFSIPAAFAGFNDTNRVLFSIDKFAAAAGLGNPVAVNYWLTSNKTANATAPAPTSASPTPTTSPTAPIQAGGAVRNSFALGGLLAAGIAFVL